MYNVPRNTFELAKSILVNFTHNIVSFENNSATLVNKFKIVCLGHTDDKTWQLALYVPLFDSDGPF